MPMSFSEKIFIQPDLPAGIAISNRGAVRGKLFERTDRNWQDPEKVKLRAFSASS